MQFGTMPWNTPLEAVKDYYGEKIGLYFTWLCHYTTYLFFASLFGILTTAYSWTYQDENAAVIPFFCVVMILWSVIYFETWKAKQAETAMKWGMSTYEDDLDAAPPRPTYVELLLRTLYPTMIKHEHTRVHSQTFTIFSGPR